MKSRQKKSQRKSHQTHHRKADISINTIIIAALGLLVLVVLIAVFTGRFGVFTKDVGTAQSGIVKCQTACSGLGGSGAELATTAAGCTSPKKLLPGGFEADKVCCCEYQ